MAGKQIYSVLEKEHREMKSAFKTLSKGYDEQVFASLAAELEKHERAEEKSFYAPIRDQKQTHEMVLEAYEEHHVADLILKEMRRGELGSEVWMAKLAVLKENVEHHIKEEEDGLFEKAKKVVDREQAIRMAEEFERLKSR